MKALYSYLQAPCNFLQIFFLFLISHSGASNLVIDKFLRCLPSHSNSSNPISNVSYTPSSASLLPVLQAYVRDSRFNKSSTPKPLAIVTALDVTHVQATILCAKSNGLQLRIRSGGHDCEGLSYVSNVPFVILDMFNLRSIDIDIISETAWVEAGATLGELYYKIANKSKIHAFPAGVCHTIGVGGHITGGGYGTMLRQFGLSIDNVIDAKVVDVNGNILNREMMGEDLFWAIKGSGAASFCVILAWKIKLVRVPKIITVFNVPRTIEQGATNLVLQWQQVAHTIDRKLFIRLQPQVQILPNGNKTVQVLAIGLYLGRAQTLLSLLRKNFSLLELQQQDCKEMPWINSTLFWDWSPPGTPLEVLLDRSPGLSNLYQKHKSDYVKMPISRVGLETIWQKMIELESVFMQWNPYGGRMNEISENATAFPHRAGNIFKMQYLSIWNDSSDEALSRNIKASKDLHATFTPFVSRNPREVFLNYRDIDIGINNNGNIEFAKGLFKDNLKRLLQVKATVDPTNFFRYEQSIPLLPNQHY